IGPNIRQFCPLTHQISAQLKPRVQLKNTHRESSFLNQCGNLFPHFLTQKTVRQAAPYRDPSTGRQTSDTQTADYLPSMCAFSFATSSSTLTPCTRQACSRLSPRAEGQPRQCIPISRK